MEPIEQIKKACGALKYQAEEEARAWADARAALDCGPHETLVDAAKRVRGDAVQGEVVRLRAEALRPTLKQLAANIYNNACVHGWWTMKTTDEPLDPVARIPECLALIHSEVSEALEAYRESTGERAELAALQWLENPMTKERKPVGFASELADVIIRVLDLTAALGIDIDAAIEQKHAYNKTRPFRHGGKLC
jgi:NTP pyrophosphatase (non-canonical NTP hydrolase)